ncbi:MAG: hypothetical protein FIA97_19025 [Methylococcaceae bacterium]|nr:hypothetical protein [Methylococcaceae bacterium]
MRLWDAQVSLALEERIERWQQYIRGWSNYFELCEYRRAIHVLESWMRRHMGKSFGSAGITGRAGPMRRADWVPSLITRSKRVVRLALGGLPAARCYRRCLTMTACDAGGCTYHQTAEPND